MATYTENVYNWLKRKGLADKYEHPGIYCIKINGKIVYVGKSRNMLQRIAEHYRIMKANLIDCMVRSVPLQYNLLIVKCGGFLTN